MNENLKLIMKDLEPSEYEGYINFWIDEDRLKTYSAHYVNTIYTDTTIARNDIFDGKFQISELANLEKITDEEESDTTFLFQMGQIPELKRTLFRAELIEKIDENLYIGSVSDFPKDVYLYLENNEYKIGDIISGSGSLEFNFPEK